MKEKSLIYKYLNKITKKNIYINYQITKMINTNFK